MTHPHTRPLPLADLQHSAPHTCPDDGQTLLITLNHGDFNYWFDAHDTGLWLEESGQQPTFHDVDDLHTGSDVCQLIADGLL